MARYRTAMMIGLALFVLCVFILNPFGAKLQHPTSLPLFKSVANREDSPADASAVAQRPRHLRQDPSQSTDVEEMKFLRQLGTDTVLPTPEEMKSMSDIQLSYIFHSYLDNIDFLCHRRIRMGNVGDGGWEVCDDYDYRPMHPCTVYSFGIHNDFSFDDDVGAMYHCQVHAFDPSMRRKSHKRSQYVQFYDIGLSGEGNSLPERTMAEAKKDKWTLATYTEIKKKLRHENKTIDLLKIDIEYSEWHALPSMLANGELRNVRQLLMEYHLYDNSLPHIRAIMWILKAIHDLGFRLFHTHINPACHILKSVYPVRRTGCYEVYYVNTNFARPSPL